MINILFIILSLLVVDRILEENIMNIYQVFYYDFLYHTQVFLVMLSLHNVR
jgi:hypothetical protein